VAAQHGPGPHTRHPPASTTAGTHSILAAAVSGAAASSQRRLRQDGGEDFDFTGLLVDPARLGAALLKASRTAGRAEAAAKAAEPARRLLLKRKTVKASAVNGYPEMVWRDVVRPASFDARALGVLSPPKDQGRCAACVAFAVTAAAEAAIALAHPALGKTIIKQGGLSPQQLYFCQSDKDRSCRQVCELGHACRVQCNPGCMALGDGCARACHA